MTLERGGYLMIYQTMNDGHKIPIIGTGTNTYGKVNNDYMGDINDDTTELQSAIEAGYRLIDTAVSYRNERVIGKAVAESDVDRSDFFIETKFPMKEGHFETDAAIDKTIEDSLKALRVDVIDLYLVHHPSDNDEDNVRVYKGLIRAQKAGKIRSVGVSNFSQQQIETLIKETGVKPVVNQIKINPTEMNHALVGYLLSEDIIPQAWGPLSGVNDEIRSQLDQIGSAYGKSWAQVLLKFHIMRGINVIPKSHNAQRQRDNLELFDFDLNDSDFNKVSEILK